MNNIDLLIEKYIGRCPGMGGSYKSMSVEVFKNPSAKEMREVAEDGRLRFIADVRKKNLYVWRYDGSYHCDVDEKYVKGDYDEDIWGVMKHAGGKWIMTRSDTREYYIDNMENVDEFLKDFKWLKNYNVDVETWFTSKKWRSKFSKWE